MLIGREKQQQELLSMLQSDESQFCAVYGRRRVGKTYLVKQTFQGQFAFQHSGVADADMSEQLDEFRLSLMNTGMKRVPKLKSWSLAFYYLEQYLTALPQEKKIVFIDEMPWMDTPKSRFVSALEHFWNGWANMRNDIILIVCGSATSWIIGNIVRNYGGLHNRLTRQIYLRPFTLKECEQYAQKRALRMPRKSILETYMVLGGIPYYWSLLKSGMSWTQNIDQLFFAERGELRNEFNALYASLFRSPQPYIDIVTALGSKKTGMTREELDTAIRNNLGGKLAEKLEELEQCDFIRSYNALGKKKRDTIYQLIDNFTLFYFKFLANHFVQDENFWSISIGKPQYNAWSGLAFERVCMQHSLQIRKALGISGISAGVYSWTYRAQNEHEHGVQIDMLIDRSDNVINICEMKFSKGKYELTADEYDKLQEKVSIFQNKSKTPKGIHIAMITSFGLSPNAYSYDIPIQLTMDDLFLH